MPLTVGLHFGPLTQKELLTWLFSNCSLLLFLLSPMQFLYTCLLFCFSSILFLLREYRALYSCHISPDFALLSSLPFTLLNPFTSL